MRWLQWATIDLANGLGGVEVHVRSIHRELLKLGIDSQISKDPQQLLEPWDVIQTHGSAIPLKALCKPSGNSIQIHTLHGTTLGRMAACKEWFWMGGYLAAARELAGVLRADVILAVHPDLWLFRHAQQLGKICAVCSNGWDSAQDGENLPEQLQESLERAKPFWVFIGRGDDVVKGTWRVSALPSLVPGLRLVAAPGTGFAENLQLIKTGKLTSGQVQNLLRQADGLLLTSYYEASPLVVLEALAQGVPVVATRVGGLSPLLPQSRGLILSDSGHPQSIADAVVAARTKFSNDSSARKKRAEQNQQIISTWKSVAQVALQTVQEVRGGKVR